MAKNSKEMESAEVETLLNEWNAALEPVPPTTVSSLHPAVAVGLGGFVLLNVGLLLSIPPVLMGRGAPYLPTFRNKLNQMFAPLPKHFASKAKKQLTFVDLGSGDGRVVFRAAREGLFHKSIGYEINPFLHVMAQSWRFLHASRYLSTTSFFVRDLWKVDLSNVDVVAVYGLHPIMDKLGVKLQEELQPGSLVLSNVFAIPGWRASRTLSEEGMHIYVVPECWKKHDGVAAADSVSNPKA